MANERFLVLSYFLVGFLCFCFGLAAYFWLRQPAEAIFAMLGRSGLGAALRKLLLASLVALSLSGFMSVSYYGGCNPRNYQEIVSSREYMLEVNRWQMSSALDWIARTALAWSGIVVLAILAIRRERNRAIGMNNADATASRSRATSTSNEP